MATDRMTPEWPATAARPKPGTSVLSIVSSVSPMRSPACPHPEPRTRATSWRSAPVRSRMTAAAASATANGSVSGSVRSWAAAVSVTLGTVARWPDAGRRPDGPRRPLDAATCTCKSCCMPSLAHELHLLVALMDRQADALLQRSGCALSYARFLVLLHVSEAD